MYQNLQAEMKQRGLTIHSLAKSIGVPASTLRDRLTGKSKLTLDDALKIQRFLDTGTVETLFNHD